jgi:hypothetical protein
VLDVIVVFNHPFPSNIPRVRSWYGPFGDVTVVTPVDGGGDVQYDTGSFLWQSAVVAALRSVPRRHANTLVVHDDVLLSPGLDVLGMLPGPDSALCHVNWALAGSVLTGWGWNLRISLGWSSPMDSLFGIGTMNCGTVLRNSLVHRRRAHEIARLPEARFLRDEEEDARRPFATPLQDLLPFRDDQFAFGLPLRFGFSDYFTFPNSLAHEVEDFLARSVRCNLFCEVAIPTMLAWLGLNLVPCRDRFEDLWEAARTQLGLRTMDDVRALFAERPDIIGIHPIKMSTFID